LRDTFCKCALSDIIRDFNGNAISAAYVTLVFVVCNCKGQRLDVDVHVFVARTQMHIDLIGMFSVLFVKGDKSG